MKTQEFTLSNLTCPSCEEHIEELENILAGVRSVKANYKKSIMDVTYDESKLSDGEIIEAVQDMGYGAQPVEIKPKKRFWHKKK